MEKFKLEGAPQEDNQENKKYPPGTILDSHGIPYSESNPATDSKEVNKRKNESIDTNDGREPSIHEDDSSIKSNKDFLDLLNKARQGGVEHEDVYWHVFGRGSASGEAYPESIVGRKDLIEKFAVGKNGEPYTSTRDAAHDLIEYLANEAENKINELNQEKKKPEEKEKSEEDEEKVEEEKFEEEKEKVEEEKFEEEKEKVEEEKFEEEKEKIDEDKNKPEKDKDIPGVDIQELGQLRDAYLQAKRLRGNVARGRFGRFFGRVLNFGEREMDFGGEAGAQDLETVRREYQEILARYRNAELSRLESQLSDRLERGEITMGDYNAEISSKICSLLTEEDTNIDVRSSQGIERNLLEKMKTSWRQANKTRLGLGLLGTALAFTPMGATAGVVGARAALGGASTYVGVEASLERYSKLIGHKGLVSEIGKSNSFVTEEGLYNYVWKLPIEDIRKEASRLRMLQVEKGVSISNLGSSGDIGGRIAEVILRRDNELTIREVVSGDGSEDISVRFADRLSERLSREINVKNITIESEVDRERLKKMVRKTISVLAGGAVGWLIGGKLFANSNPESDVLPEVHSASTESYSLDPGMEVFKHTAGEGENTWKIIEANLDNRHLMDGLNPGQRTHVIDSLKDAFEKMSPEHLKEIGFSSGDVDLLNPGENIDLTEVLGKPETILSSLFNAKNLSPEDISSIVKNNTQIANWLKEHHGELKQVFDGEMVEKVLKGVV